MAAGSSAPEFFTSVIGKTVFEFDHQNALEDSFKYNFLSLHNSKPSLEYYQNVVCLRLKAVKD